MRANSRKNMNTTIKIGSRLNEAAARRITSEDGLNAFVYGYADSSNAKNHAFAIGRLLSDVEKLASAKTLGKVDNVAIVDGRNYVRMFAIDRQDGDTCEANINGIAARFSLASLKAIAEKAGAKVRIVSRKAAQSYLDGDARKIHAVEKSMGCFRADEMGQALALDYVKRARLTFSAKAEKK